MNKFFILLLIFNIFSCEKEVTKKEVPSTPTTSIPVLQHEGRIVSIDSVLLNSFDSKILKYFYKSSGYKTVWQSKKIEKSYWNNSTIPLKKD
ncbi:hypothetical protein [Flavobacterium sp.]|uniref:hypothetical protein n=1 Tax=Flavobacterium sp. TaxID=239 RepID=UPI00374FE3B4